MGAKSGCLVLSLVDDADIRPLVLPQTLPFGSFPERNHSILVQVDLSDGRIRGDLGQSRGRHERLALFCRIEVKAQREAHLGHTQALVSAPIPPPLSICTYRGEIPRDPEEGRRGAQFLETEAPV